MYEYVGELWLGDQDIVEIKVMEIIVRVTAEISINSIVTDYL